MLCSLLGGGWLGPLMLSGANAMNPYDILMKNLRDAGYDPEELANGIERLGVKPVHVFNVVRDRTSGRPCFIRHTPGNTVIVFNGFQVVLDRLTLLIDREVARDFGL